MEALDSGRGDEGFCAFVVEAGAWVDGGAILDLRAMGAVERGRGLVWSSFTGQKSSVLTRLITRLVIHTASANSREVHGLLFVLHLRSS